MGKIKKYFFCGSQTKKNILCYRNSEIGAFDWENQVQAVYEPRFRSYDTAGGIQSESKNFIGFEVYFETLPKNTC